MGKFFTRSNRPAIIALSVITVALAVTVYAFVSLSQRSTPENAGPPPTQKLPAASAQPTVNTANFASASPAATGCAHPVSLQQTTGAWMAGYNDDKQNTSEIPSRAAQFGVLDFDWLTFNTPGSLIPADQFSESLSTVLSADAQANPCTLRFVTINDQGTTTSQDTLKKVMAEILTEPSVMNEHVAAIASEMASLP